MNITELAVLLPCHSLEDFPLYHEAEEAASLMVAWNALWHPALIAACDKMPRWYRADFPPEDSKGRVYLIPPLSQRMIAAGWTARMESEGAIVCIASDDRQRTVSELIAKTGLDDSTVGDELALDFLALGYAYLQMELLTRQMRYMSSLDEPYFEGEIVAGARAAMESNSNAAREHLQRCFDVLMEARDRFYPVDAYLLDIALLADSLIDARLPEKLSSTTPFNLHLTGKVLDFIAQTNPDLMSSLRTLVADQSVCVVGGEYEEKELPLLPVSEVIANLERGLAVYQGHLNTVVRVFMRRRFGLSPMLPMILSRTGFVGAVHSTFDDGVFPAIGQSKTRWQGLDGSAIDAFGRIPLDASRPETFVGLSQKLAESMDLDHVAAVAFVHWPGHTSPWFDDLKRISGYAALFGKFVTLEHFFQNTDMAGRLDKFEADDYRTPYLKQAVERGETDPISRFARGIESDLRCRVARSGTSLAELIRGSCRPSDSAARAQDCNVDLAVRALATAAGVHAGGDSALFAFNPFAQSEPWELSTTTAFSIDRSIDVPGFGFTWIAAPQPNEATPRDKKMPSMVSENRLTNEYLEVTVDPATGGIRAIRDFRHRGNRLSQQLALRLPGPTSTASDIWRHDERAVYSTMAADRIDCEATSHIAGRITSRGRLINDVGDRLADFEQRISLVRGSRVLWIDVQLEPAIVLPADPWNAYFACRFAWADEAANLFRSVHETLQITRRKRFEAPHFVEVREDRKRTAILCAGLPYHRRSQYRMLDTLLIVAGETRRHFRIGVGIDLPAIAGNSEAMVLGGVPHIQVQAPSSGPRSGWFFHLDSQNVMSVDWTSIVEEGKSVGFRARFLETEGRAGRVKLRAFKPIAEARQMDGRGACLAPLSVSGDTVLMTFSAFELLELEARWAG